VLEDWLTEWREFYGINEPLTVRLRPNRDGADVLELSVLGAGGDDDRKANLVFAPITDRHGHVILSVRDQNTFDSELRKKRLMTLLHLYVLKRYGVTTVHYVTPTEDNDYQAKRMAAQGLFSDVNTEVGQIIVAKVNTKAIDTLADDVDGALSKLIRKES
jgi:isocitrate lyase